LETTGRDENENAGKFEVEGGEGYWIFCKGNEDDSGRVGLEINVLGVREELG
jgi:hypothetical protein